MSQRNHKPTSQARQRRRLSAENLEARLALSVTPFDVAVQLAHSREHYANDVGHAYQQYLGRDADDAGKNYWVDKLQAGLTREQLESGFIGSPEYIANHGGNKSEWVKGMYHDLLGREPEDAGLHYWEDRLAGGTPEDQVAAGFAASPERESQRIRHDYETHLGRTPDDSEVEYWTDRFRHGARSEDILAGLIGSPEYYELHHDNGDEWLKAAFNDILGRGVDDDALEFYRDEMEGIRIENGEARVEGTISAVDTVNSTVTIHTASAGDVTVTVDGDTKIEAHDKHVSIGGLTIGDRGEARYSPTTLIATKIESTPA